MAKTAAQIANAQANMARHREATELRASEQKAAQIRLARRLDNQRRLMNRAKMHPQFNAWLEDNGLPLSYGTAARFFAGLAPIAA